MIRIKVTIPPSLMVLMMIIPLMTMKLMTIVAMITLIIMMIKINGDNEGNINKVQPKESANHVEENLQLYSMCKE